MECRLLIELYVIFTLTLQGNNYILNNIFTVLVRLASSICFLYIASQSPFSFFFFTPELVFPTSLLLIYTFSALERAACMLG